MRFPEPSPVPGFELEHDDVVHAGVALRVFRFAGGLVDPARAIVCQHGMSASGVSFARLRGLADRWDFRLVSAPVDGYPGESITGLSRAIGSYLGGFERPILLGTSWGSMVAIRTAIDGGDGLRALVLPSAFARNSKMSGLLSPFRWVAPSMQRWMPRFAPISASVVGGRGLDADGRRELAREAREVTASERARRLRDVFSTDLRPGLGAIHVPAIVIHGSSDLLVSRRDSRELADGIPGCEWAEIAGAGHVPYLTRPEEFVEILGGFLGSLSR